VTIVDEDARALLIASLQYTDLVIIFDEDTPEKLIELIDPNVLVMGQEYEQQYMDKLLPGQIYIDERKIDVGFVPEAPNYRSSYLRKLIADGEQ